GSRLRRPRLRERWKCFRYAITAADAWLRKDCSWVLPRWTQLKSGAASGNSRLRSKVSREPFRAADAEKGHGGWPRRALDCRRLSRVGRCNSIAQQLLPRDYNVAST